MYLKRGSCAAVKRDAKFLSRYLKGVTFVNTKHEGVLFLAQMVKGKRLDLGPQLTHCKVKYHAVETI